MTPVDIALNRFGLGARPDEAPPADARAWLVAQLSRFDPAPAPIAAQPSRGAIAGELADYLAAQRMARQEGRRMPEQPMPAATPAMMASAPTAAAMTPAPRTTKPGAEQRRMARVAGRDTYVAAVGARASAALVTPAPFAERLVHFWANHFAVSADKLTVVGLTGNFEFEAIRPHVLGSFRDMLSAVERHPAMLLYLDQAQSVGPDSPLGVAVAARGQRKLGINENLGREIMELHTLGVRTGYSQADVTEFARALTGWTVAGIGRGAGARFVDAAGKPGDFVFAARLHQPGARTIMGRSFAAGGEEQAQAVLDMLAVHPATAHHVATKLARHFVADDPPPALVAKLEAAFLSSKGDLPTVYRALIDAPEAWAPTPAKFRSPWEWSVATMRALGLRQVAGPQAVGLLDQLGQPTWRPGSPAGYDDVAGTWAGPDAVMRRVEAAERFANRAGAGIDARALGPRLFPASLSATTTQALARAESPGQGLALLLASPEMMRR